MCWGVPAIWYKQSVSAWLKDGLEARNAGQWEREWMVPLRGSAKVDGRNEIEASGRWRRTTEGGASGRRTRTPGSAPTTTRGTVAVNVPVFWLA